ncbi:hypothetical protein PVK06_005354 [Gossypium arboreum]|uniref:Transmembrane protein n=6 Tax=Gossypium TaxID=3633 RepID=A0ABR0QVM3_GOSAR|nr:hypothetical protein PVK06_005354 [Gossypium arboreum]
MGINMFRLKMCLCCRIYMLCMCIVIVALISLLLGIGGNNGLRKLKDAFHADYCDPKISSCGRPFLVYPAPPPF